MEAAEPSGPGRISGSDSLAGLATEGGVALAVGTLVGLDRLRLAKASKVPSGSTITLITETQEAVCETTYFHVEQMS